MNLSGFLKNDSDYAILLFLPTCLEFALLIAVGICNMDMHLLHSRGSQILLLKDRDIGLRPNILFPGTIFVVDCKHDIVRFGDLTALRNAWANRTSAVFQGSNIRKSVE